MSKTREIATLIVPRDQSGTSDRDKLTCVDEIDFSAIGSRRQPRDEAALLLTVGAEIEHALMVQYLYAAYSIRQDQENHEFRGRVSGFAKRLIQIAREEMGHFITVQNLLLLIGAPLHFDREDSPFESVLYPFNFKLEPLSKASLAKYVTAESPGTRPVEFSDAEWSRICAIACDAKKANDGQNLRHVGELYARIIRLFEDPDQGLKDNDFVLNPAFNAQQAQDEDWGFDPGSRRPEFGGAHKVQVGAFTADNAAAQRRAAVNALKELAEQGEGFGAGLASHFERFLSLYDEFDILKQQVGDFVYPVATNPTIIPTQQQDNWNSCSLAAGARAAFADSGYIRAARSRDWAALFNVRYRLLLAFLAHFMSSSGPRYIEHGPDKGDPTVRGLLLIWTFDEMRRIKKIAGKLAQLPLNENDDGLKTGAPFQLPYSLSVSNNEPDRWRTHLDVVQTGIDLISDLKRRTGSIDGSDPFLGELEAADKLRKQILVSLTAGKGVPGNLLPKDFSKVVHILEQAVRGFTINVHGNFWTDRTRGQFVDQHLFNRVLFPRKPGDCASFNAEDSYLLQNIGPQGGMPAYRPKIPASRRKFIADWLRAGAPDNQPAETFKLHSEPAPAEEPVSSVRPVFEMRASNPVVSFAADIRPLFREFDRDFLMRFDRVDLDSLASVRRRAGYLLGKLEAGVFPYDVCWPDEKIALFGRWIADGKPD